MEQNKNNLEIAYIVSIIIIFLIATSYFIVNNKKNEILKNWEGYRCKPYVIPFASIFGVNTFENYSSCSWNILKVFFSKLVKPILYVFEMIFKNMSNMANTLNFMRKYIYSVRKFIMSYILDLMNRLESFTETLRFTLIKVNVMIKKNQALITIVKYITQILVSMLSWIKNIVRPIIMSIILWGISMSYILWLIFPPFSYIMGTLAAGAGLSYSCFGPDVKIALLNGELIPIKNIDLSMMMKNRSIVRGIIRTKPDFNNLYDLHGTVVTGDHPILFNDKWVRINKHPNAKKIYCDGEKLYSLNKYQEEYKNYDKEKLNELYCLITSDNRIFIGEDEYSDYTESDINSLSTKNLILSKLNNKNIEISPEEDVSIFGFLSNMPIRMLNGDSKAISYIEIGDKLYNNDEVLSVIRMTVDHNIHFYLYNNEIIVSGGQIVYEDEKWICVYQSKKAVLLSDNCKPLELYHINTVSGIIHIGNSYFRDFIEIKDSYTNDLIEENNLQQLNHNLSI